MKILYSLFVSMVILSYYLDAGGSGLPTQPATTPANFVFDQTQPIDRETFSALVENDSAIKFFGPILNSLKFSYGAYYGPPGSEREKIELYFMYGFDWMMLAENWKDRALYLKDKAFSSYEEELGFKRSPLVDTSYYEALRNIVESFRNSSNSIASLYQIFKNKLIKNTDILLWLLNETGDKVIIFCDNKYTFVGDRHYGTWGAKAVQSNVRLALVGKNYFGFMLMMLRDELRRESTKIHTGLAVF